MEEFNWTPSLDVGNEAMNDEHKELINKMRNLIALNQRSLSKNDLLFYYDDLVSYTKRHFRDEEVYLKSINYPGLEQHKRIHTGLTDALDRYREEFKSSVSGRFPSSVFDFFRTWITSHILVVDKSYSELAKSGQNLKNQIDT